MSKERARRRAARRAELEQRQHAAARRGARAARWHALKDRLLPRRGRVGRMPIRRSRAQFAGIALGLTVVQVVCWNVTDSWPFRIAIGILSLVTVPVFVTLTLDRSTR